MHGTGQIRSGEALDLFVRMCQSPTMYVQDATFSSVCALIEGYDMATNRHALLGFWEWLTVRDGQWTNLPWWSLVRRHVYPDADLGVAPSRVEDAPLL
jgi:hypothetical protein